MSHCQNEKALLNRLSRIEGQVRGIKNMIQEERSCEDILNQIASIESAMHKVGIVVLEDHLSTCFVNDIKAGKEADSIKQIKSIIEKFL